MVTTAEPRRVQVTQGEVEVREFGAGKPLLLLHGALVDWTLWEAVIERLSGQGYRLIVPTLPLGAHTLAMLPGADLTPPGLAGLLAELIRSLDVGPVTIVANDTGTALTQILLAEQPELVERAVLTSGDAFERFLPPIFKPLQALPYLPGGLQLLGRAMRRPRLMKLPPAFGWLTLRGLTPEQAQAWSTPVLTDAGVRRDTRAFLKGIDSRHTQAAAQQLPRAKLPVLLVWAEHDRAFPRRYAERLRDVLPDATLVTVPDSAAFIPLDNPNRLAELIVSFVSTTPAAS